MFDKLWIHCVSLALLMLISACSKTFVVTGEYPEPLVDGMPVVAQMHYSDEFKTYAYIEKGDDRALETVELGAAQVGLFDRIFGSLFTLVEGDSATPDLKIEPQVLDFQYSAPVETKLKLYEVWLKYRLKITDSEGQELADWVVKGYGKTPSAMLSSHLKALNTASIIALRDVGAQLAIGFRTQPNIEQYLSERTGSNLVTQVSVAEPSDQTDEINAQLPDEVEEVKP